jgi:hypothetical protein
MNFTSQAEVDSAAAAAEWWWYACFGLGCAATVSLVLIAMILLAWFMQWKQVHAELR